MLMRYNVTQLFDLCHILSFYDIPEYGKEIAELNFDGKRFQMIAGPCFTSFLNDLKDAKGEKWMHETIKDWCDGDGYVNDMVWMDVRIPYRT